MAVEISEKTFGSQNTCVRSCARRRRPKRPTQDTKKAKCIFSKIIKVKPVVLIKLSFEVMHGLCHFYNSRGYYKSLPIMQEHFSKNILTADGNWDGTFSNSKFLWFEPLVLLLDLVYSLQKRVQHGMQLNIFSLEDWTCICKQIMHACSSPLGQEYSLSLMLRRTHCKHGSLNRKQTFWSLPSQTNSILFSRLLSPILTLNKIPF